MYTQLAVQVHLPRVSMACGLSKEAIGFKELHKGHNICITSSDESSTRCNVWGPAGR